jgi:hypothetical protein
MSRANFENSAIVGRIMEQEEEAVRGREPSKWEQIRQQIESQGFVVDKNSRHSIHSAESRRFMKEVIGAGGWH